MGVARQTDVATGTGDWYWRCLTHQQRSTKLTCGVFRLLHSVFTSPTMQHQCCTILTPGIFIHAAPAAFMPTYVHTCLIPSFIYDLNSLFFLRARPVSEDCVRVFSPSIVPIAADPTPLPCPCRLISSCSRVCSTGPSPVSNSTGPWKWSSCPCRLTRTSSLACSGSRT